MAPDPLAVLAEFERLAQLPLWPGFVPFEVPLALYDGERTVLVRHPDPPQEFAELPGKVMVFPGRHPAVHANTVTELGGVLTATLILDEGRSIRELAALLLHEAFHAFQRKRHPDWLPNEAEYFSYPVEDAELLWLRRLETEALRRALAAEAPASWCGRFLELRRRRFAELPEGSMAYERALELFEGLARYIELRAQGLAMEDLPHGGFAPEEVRLRCYKVGAALGFLLDRLLPGWKERLEEGEAVTLDGLLESALEKERIPAESFTRDEEEAARKRAEEDLRKMLAERAEVEREFLARPGWRIILLAQGEPLWPQGFDPMNIRRLGGNRLLHSRWLKLGNDRGTVEIFRGVLTEGAGDHPLFQGVRRLVVTGLPAEPRLEGVSRLEAQGLHLELEGAQIERQETKTIMVRV